MSEKKAQTPLTPSDLAMIKQRGNNYFLSMAKPTEIESSEFFVYCYMLAFNDVLKKEELVYKASRGFQEPIE